MSRVLSRKTQSATGPNLFVLKREFNQLFFLKNLTKFKLDKTKVKL